MSNEISGRDWMIIDDLFKQMNEIKRVWDNGNLSSWQNFKKEMIEEKGAGGTRFENEDLNKCFRGAYLLGVFHAIRYMETHPRPWYPQIDPETPAEELIDMFCGK